MNEYGTKFVTAEPQDGYVNVTAERNGERAGGCCSKAAFRGSIFPQILR